MRNGSSLSGTASRLTRSLIKYRGVIRQAAPYQQGKTAVKTCRGLEQYLTSPTLPLCSTPVASGGYLRQTLCAHFLNNGKKETRFLNFWNVQPSALRCFQILR